MRFCFNRAPNNNAVPRAGRAGAWGSGVGTKPSKVHPWRESALIYRFQPTRQDQAPVRRPGRFKRWSIEEARSLRRLAKTMTARGIAAVLGRSLSSIERYAQRHKISLRKYGDDNPDTRYPDALVELARQMNEEGMSARRVAEALGLSVGSAKNYIHYRARLTPALVHRGCMP